MNSVLKMFQNEEFTINDDGRIVIEDEKQGEIFLDFSMTIINKG
ncbi:hypothetical protein [Pectobacterium polaris]|nr:hypothetical protein [Pectobacterium polaris]